ncbi:hypothetical protein ACFPRL_23205 [Pseudoclavibacter helvolus]
MWPRTRSRPWVHSPRRTSRSTSLMKTRRGRRSPSTPATRSRLSSGRCACTSCHEPRCSSVTRTHSSSVIALRFRRGGRISPRAA